MAPDSEAPATRQRSALGNRTHPATALVRVWIWLVAAAVGSWQSLRDERPSWSFALILAAVLVVGLAFGAASWWFTRYVIDGTELRIDSGVLTKRSRRIPYERLQSVDIAQPFAARIFGLSELRIEMAGGGDSRTRLQYLRYDDARALRRVLLDRAAGEPHETDSTLAPEPDRQVIASVPPHRLVVGTLLSVDFLVAVGVIVVVVVGATALGLLVATVSVLVSFGAWAVQIVAKRVVAEWGFTLTRTSRGLRIERGLLSRSSQTVPFDRVQGVAVEQPVLWRRLGWSRLAVDVAGYAGTSDDHEAAPSTLLPVALADQVHGVVDELLPGVDPQDVDRCPAPRRSAMLAPVGWRFRSAGAGERAFVSTTGWLVRSESVVPHAKTQSVSLKQGPLQRRLRLATVSVHTPDGPVHAEGRNLDAGDARSLAYGQLARARSARSA